MSELTGGKIFISDIKDLKEDISKILIDKIIAFDVEVKCILYPALKFRNQLTEEIKIENKVHCLVRKLGNVTAKTSFIIEYHCIDLLNLFELGDLNLKELTQFPF